MFVTVAMGAFGAHALKGRLDAAMVEVWKTAVLYQGLHALAMLLLAALAGRPASGPVSPAGWLFLAGTVLFSGSLYALALTGQKAWGAVTPVGGLCFLAGWLALAIAK
ncbi:MAG TPA: DUF423 domain-containing protein [Candidatus Eisenbacteria bacterium]|nr:DUF423 domain-containing protein [Candidatus Eisenbacteria bacterium]